MRFWKVVLFVFMGLSTMSCSKTALAGAETAKVEYFGMGGQDRWILEEIFPEVRHGYFVDVGAWDAEKTSNTKALELAGWDGTCIEPLPVNWKNRRCRLFEEVVFSRKGDIVKFREGGALGGIDDHLGSLKAKVENQPTREFVTTTLEDILERAGAPDFIHYVSLDIEGAELEALKGFPFSRYKVGAWTIEHNFEKEKREAVRKLLDDNGYRFVREQVTDDFFISKDLDTKVAEKAMTDLKAIREALEAYYRDHKAYPDTSRAWVGKCGARDIGQMEGPPVSDWIEGLVPQYLSKLPVDRRKSDDCALQYLYTSNGSDYKLISHYPADLPRALELNPALFDPHRPNHAFGYFTEGASNW